MITETKAVVLRTMKYGDTSKIVTLYSRKFGKIKVIAKGARNQKTNKFGSSLEPMTVSSVVIYKKEHKDLHLLSKSEILTPMSRLQEVPERMFAGLAIVELVNMVMHDEEENGPVFDLLEQSIAAVNASERQTINILMAFMVHLFRRFGFGLDVDACLRCGRTLGSGDLTYGLLRLSDGKFHCSQCVQEEQQSGVRLNIGTLRTLKFLADNPVEKASGISMNQAMRDDLLSFLQSFLRYHIEGVRTLRSLALLQSMG